MAQQHAGALQQGAQAAQWVQPHVSPSTHLQLPLSHASPAAGAHHQPLQVGGVAGQKLRASTYLSTDGYHYDSPAGAPALLSSVNQLELRRLADQRPHGTTLSATTSAEISAQEDDILFQALSQDVGGSGQLSLAEFLHLIPTLGLAVSVDYVEGVWTLYDTIGSGQLSRQQFGALMHVLRRKHDEVRTPGLERSTLPPPASLHTNASRTSSPIAFANPVAATKANKAVQQIQMDQQHHESMRRTPSGQPGDVLQQPRGQHNGVRSQQRPLAQPTLESEPEPEPEREVSSGGSFDSDEDRADENTALLSEHNGSLRAEVERNAKIMDALATRVIDLEHKDEAIQRAQQIDDQVDDSCETLATFVSLAFLAPTFSRSHRLLTLILTLSVWGMQVAITSKLYANGKINDGGQVMLDLGSGYMEMNRTMASAECNGCCELTVHSIECRLAMMEAFENAIFERKAGQCDGCEFDESDSDPATIGNRRKGGDRWSSEVYDMNLPWSPRPNEGGISLCFSERGLANGWLNLFAGMMIVIITLIREVQESLGSIYVVIRLHKDDRKGNCLALLSYIWVLFIVGLHCLLGVYLMYASFRRMINVPNDIWGVVESSISAFLVVQIDDAVLEVVKLHPTTKKALEPLGQMKIAAKESQHVSLADLCQSLCKAREHHTFPEKADETANEKFDKQFERRVLMHKNPVWETAKHSEDAEYELEFLQPSEHIKTAGGDLILFDSMIGWIYMHFFFAFIGGRLAKFTDLACEDAKQKHDAFRVVSLIIGKGGPLMIVIAGLLLDVRSICGDSADRNRRIVRCMIFYIAAFHVAEMFSSPAWWSWWIHDETDGMLWAVRLFCFLALFVAIPTLSEARWEHWFSPKEQLYADV